MILDFTTEATVLPCLRASLYVSSEKGATSPGRWHVTHFAFSNGAMSRQYVGRSADGTLEQLVAISATRRNRNLAARNFLSLGYNNRLEVRAAIGRVCSLKSHAARSPGRASCRNRHSGRQAIRKNKNKNRCLCARICFEKKRARCAFQV